MPQTMYTNLIVKMKITLLLSKTFNSFNKNNSLIEKFKHKYYVRLSKKLSDPATTPKLYWSILKIFLNNKKLPCIPPLLHENKFVIDFRSKAEIFNTFFCETIFSYKYLQWSCYTLKWVTVIHFASDDILKIIKNLDLSKTHGYDMISILMVKLCGASLCKPFELILNEVLKMESFSWMVKSKCSSVHKKGD